MSHDAATSMRNINSGGHEVFMVLGAALESEGFFRNLNQAMHFTPSARRASA